MVELEPGSYKVVDVTSHQSTIVNLVGNTQVWVLIEDVLTQSGGVGEEPGGGDPGGGDPNDPDDPDDGTGSNGGGTGGTGNPDGGPGGVDDTNGGMDAGSNDILDYDAELASVTGLPETGSGPLGNTDTFTLILLLGGLVVAAGTGRRLLARRAA